MACFVLCIRGEQAGRGMGAGSHRTGEDEAGAAPLRRYANFFDIDFTISEIELRFGQNFGAVDAPVVHSWLVTTPVHLVALARAVNTTLVRYHERFGEIPGSTGIAPVMARQ